MKQKVSIFTHLFINTVALLIAFSIYFCPIKCRTKQKHLLQYYVKIDKLKNVL